MPSVTEILHSEFPQWQGSEWDLQRGKVVHSVAAMIASGEEWTLNLDNQTREDKEKILGQIAGIQSFFKDWTPRVISVEKPVYSKRHQFAGTPDLICNLQSIGISIVDYKSNITHLTRYQIAGYAVCYQETKKTIPCGAAVELRYDGTYRIEIYKKPQMRQHMNGWQAIRTVHAIHAAMMK